MELLKRRFGKKTAVERAHMAELLKAAPVYGDRDTARLRALCDHVETHYRGLEALGVPEETYSSIVVPALLKKLPEAVRLTMTRGEAFLEWMVRDLLDKLREEVELREDHRLQGSVSKVGQGRQDRKGIQAASGSALFTKTFKDGCAFCLGDHLHEDCKTVTDKGKHILEREVHRLWDFDSVGIRETIEVHEAFCDNITFNGTRYSVGLPWKVSHATLPTNYDNSRARRIVRESRVALVGDIEKAFLNIEVDEVDRDVLRFLWVDDVTDDKSKVNVYRFCRVVFGLNASPFLLNGTIRHHLGTYAGEDHRFVTEMINGFYVDDLVTGEKTVSEAYALFEKAKVRMGSGGFKLRKWLTNNPDLRDKIEMTERQVGEANSRRLDEMQTYAKASLATQSVSATAQKVLGVAWNCETDTVHFSFEQAAAKAKEKEPTKRNVVSIIASLFDPLGIFSPVTVSMKILFQELCVGELDWDQELSGETK
ncbi:hypothetical protein QZH41_010939, partial [Actinostola sp. cb2023]